MPDDLPDRLEGAASSATLDHQAQTLVFEHFGSVCTAKQQALSPLVIQLGSIAEVKCRPGRSTNWFWVVPRGQKPWRDGVWCDPHGVVCGIDPTDFAERVKLAVAGAVVVVEGPVDASIDAVPATGRRGRLAKRFGGAIVDGFFNSR